MADPFLSEIKIFSFGYAPRGWASCNGQLLPINQNQALFSLLGTTYGGDGRTTFALPNLQGRVPIHMGQGHLLGERAGEQAHTLTNSELPLHQHLMSSNNAVVGAAPNATQGSPGGNFWANNGKAVYTTSPGNSTMSPQAVGTTGGSQAHLNMQPFLVLNFCIALVGIFPSQN
jgi:microcystin-dependent protein